MSWVNPEYRGEFAVLSTWLCLLLPWSVTVADEGGLTAIWIRYPPGRFLHVLGAKLPDDADPFLWVWEIGEFVVTEGEEQATIVWMIASFVFACALLFSVSYYVNEDSIEEQIDQPARVLGALLVGSGLIYGVAAVVQIQNLPGSTYPVGAAFQLVLGTVVLLTDAP